MYSRLRRSTRVHWVKSLKHKHTENITFNSWSDTQRLSVVSFVLWFSCVFVLTHTRWAVKYNYILCLLVQQSHFYSFKREKDVIIWQKANISWTIRDLFQERNTSSLGVIKFKERAIKGRCGRTLNTASCLTQRCFDRRQRTEDGEIARVQITLSWYLPHFFSFLAEMGFHSIVFLTKTVLNNGENRLQAIIFMQVIHSTCCL